MRLQRLHWSTPQAPCPLLAFHGHKKGLPHYDLNEGWGSLLSGAFEEGIGDGGQQILRALFQTFIL